MALDWIKARRSIRKYTPEPVGEEQVRSLLEAAMSAPSADNIKPWEFVVVRDAAVRRDLSQAHQWAHMAAQAPIVIVVCGREDVSRHWVQDCSAATENLLLAASALGLGAVWVGIYPDTASEAAVRAALSLAQGVRPLCLVPLGHPAEQHPPRTQYDEGRVHHDRF